MSPDAVTRVLLYSHQRFLAEGLKGVLEPRGDFVVIAMVDDLSLIPSHHPDIVLLDINSKLSLSAIRDLRQPIQVVLWGEPNTLEFAMQAIDVGIRGILPLSMAPDELVRALLSIRDGHPWFAQPLAQRLLCSKCIPLTKRESHIVTLLTEGLSNKEIAYRLNLQVGTVKVYLSRLFAKLGVTDRFELALYGLRNSRSGFFDPAETTATQPQTREPLRQLHFYPPSTAAHGDAPSPVDLRLQSRGGRPV